MLLARAARPRCTAMQPSVLSRQLHASRPVADRGKSPPSDDEHRGNRRNPLIGAFQTPEPQSKPHVDPQLPKLDEISSAAARLALSSTTKPPPRPPPPRFYAGKALERQKEMLQRDNMGAYDAVSQPLAQPSSESSESPPSAINPFELDIASIIANKAAAFGQEMRVGDPTKLPRVRTAASTGRTIFVRPTAGHYTASSPTMALGSLNRLVKYHQIKNKFHSQRTHERKGLKKKNLKSLRWRARFKEGFKAACVRVKELKRQGW